MARSSTPRGRTAARAHEFRRDVLAWLSLGLVVALLEAACEPREARHESAPSPPAQTVPATPANVASADTGWNSAETVQLSGVRYAPSTQVFGVLGVTVGDGYVDSIGPGQKIGTLVAGKYRGADFISALRNTDEPCKGEGCDNPIYVRFARLGDTLTFLRQNSDGGEYFEHSELQVWRKTFSAAGFTLVSDSQFAVPAFLPSDSMSYDAKTFHLVSRRCDTATARVVFSHPVFQSVRFDGQLFHVIRPDGSCLTFEYVPYFSEKEIRWDTPPKEPNRSGYSWRKGAEFGNPEVRYDPFIPADDVRLDRDAVVVGHTQRGEPVYELKDPNHPLLKAFYHGYLADFAKAADYPSDEKAGGIQPPKRSYEQFVGTRPIFLWRDPFGRLMRFTNNDFLPVYMAEPVIYVYPTTPERVHVEAKPLSGIKASIPRYDGGWDVLAQPSGTLTGTRDQKTYSYLFWEGASAISPMRQEGFVMAQGEVARFLERILPRLGLNERESKDFRDAWLPRFRDAPYYFITFLQPETIDRLAPLVVTPKPDAVIRVLMDFRPLWTKATVKAPDLPRAPERHGFTVVEWGGLLR